MKVVVVKMPKFLSGIVKSVLKMNWHGIVTDISDYISWCKLQKKFAKEFVNKDITEIE